MEYHYLELVVFFSTSNQIFNKYNKDNFKVTKIYKEQKKIEDFQSQIIVGLLLGDVSAERTKSTQNTRLRFEQSIKHKNYILFLYDLFKDFVGTPPSSPTRKPHNKTGIIYETIAFKTLRFPCFNYYYELFYKNSIKIIPLNLVRPAVRNFY